LNVIVSYKWYLTVMLCTISPLLFLLFHLPPPRSIKEIGRWPVPASMNSILRMICQELALASVLEKFGAHLIPLELTILLDKGYKLWSSSLCSFLQPDNRFFLHRSKYPISWNYTRIFYICVRSSKGATEFHFHALQFLYILIFTLKSETSNMRHVKGEVIPVTVRGGP
jgi:hypothetical protein